MLSFDSRQRHDSTMHPDVSHEPLVPPVGTARWPRLAILWPVFLAALVIAAALSLRLALIVFGLPRFDSDEGTMGLMALHIIHHGEWPVFFYGQSYMGALEAYLGSLSFRLFGASDLTLRLGPLLLTGLFLVVMFRLMTLLYDRRAALLSLLLLGLGSQELIDREVKAVGGYPEILFFGSAILLVAAQLALSRPGTGVRRMLTFALWGLLSGLGLWSHPLVLPFVVTSGALLLVTGRREILGPSGPLLALGLLVGLSPVIAYTVAGGRNPISVVVQVAEAGGSGHVTASAAPVGQRIAGTFLVSIPVMTGGDALCGIASQDAWPITARSSSHIVLCTAVHGTWSGLLIALWLLAVTGPMAAARRTRQELAPSRLESGTREIARLALLASATLTVGLFLLTPASAHAPWFNVRYLTGIWVAIPALFAGLLERVAHRTVWRTPASLLAGCGATVLFAVVLALSTAGAFADSYTPWANHQLRLVAAYLRSEGERHIFTDYWTCDWIAFETGERITCAALDTHLRPSLDRYPPYRSAVRHDRTAAYVFPRQSEQEAAFDRRLRQNRRRYRETIIQPFVIFSSAMSIPGPG